MQTPGVHQMFTRTCYMFISAESQGEPRPKVMMVVEHVELWTVEEQRCFKGLRDHNFTVMRVFDGAFLERLGHNSDFEVALQIGGWYDFYCIYKQGSKWLTIEFLCHLASRG